MDRVVCSFEKLLPSIKIKRQHILKINLLTVPYNGLNDLAIEKIRALGIDLTSTSNGGLTVRIPQ